MRLCATANSATKRVLRAGGYSPCNERDIWDKVLLTLESQARADKRGLCGNQGQYFKGQAVVLQQRRGKSGGVASAEELIMVTVC